jgi:uncharacterized protein (DUF1778 family)
MVGADKGVVVSVRITKDLMDRIDRVANESGLGRTAWITAVWARAAHEGAFAPQGEGGAPTGVIISVRVTQSLRASIETAAKASKRTLMDWIRAVWSRAANEGAFAPQGGTDAMSRNRTASKRRGAPK